MPTRRYVLAAGAAGILSATTGFVPPARAQVVKKPVHVIVGFPAGGGTDIIARILADRLRGSYAATVLVENKPGAAARLSVEYVKNAEPDGSVMLFTPDFPITVYPHSFRSLNYDPLRDFTPVAPAARSMLTYNVGAGGAGQREDAGRLRAVVQSKSGQGVVRDHCGGRHAPFRRGDAGQRGRRLHDPGALSRRSAGAAGSGRRPRLASINPISESMSFAKAGTIRILAVTGSRRSAFLPEVPTMVEAGYNVVVESWLGVFVPAKTPADIVGALSAAIGEAVKSSQMIENLAKVGNTTAFQSPQEFAATVKADIARWAPVVKASGFVAED